MKTPRHWFILQTSPPPHILCMAQPTLVPEETVCLVSASCAILNNRITVGLNSGEHPGCIPKMTGFWKKEGFAPTRSTFQSRRRTFFMGKCGAWPLQNLVTIVKSRRANGSSVCTGKPGGERDQEQVQSRSPIPEVSPLVQHDEGTSLGHNELCGSLSSILKVSRQVFHSGGSISCSTRMFSTIRYMTLSSTLPGQHGRQVTLPARGHFVPRGCPTASTQRASGEQRGGT